MAEIRRENPPGWDGAKTLYIMGKQVPTSTGVSAAFQPSTVLNKQYFMESIPGVFFCSGMEWIKLGWVKNEKKLVGCLPKKEFTIFVCILLVIIIPQGSNHLVR